MCILSLALAHLCVHPRSLPTALQATLLGPVWSGEEVGKRTRLFVQVVDRYGNDVAGIDSLKWLLIGFSSDNRRHVKFIQGGRAFASPVTGKANITSMEIEAVNQNKPFTTVLNITSDDLFYPWELFGQLVIAFETCRSGWVPPSNGFGNCVRCAPGMHGRPVLTHDKLDASRQVLLWRR